MYTHTHTSHFSLKLHFRVTIGVPPLLFTDWLADWPIGLEIGRIDE